MKHTQTPWELFTISDNSFPVKARHFFVAKKKGEKPIPLASLVEYSPHVSSLEQEANAKRIVECVNACSDIVDPIIEIKRLKAIEKISLNALNKIKSEYTQMAESIGDGVLLEEDELYLEIMMAIEKIQSEKH